MAAAGEARPGAPDLAPAAGKSITRVAELPARAADRVQAAAGAVAAAAPTPAADAEPLGPAPREFRGGESVEEHTRRSKAGGARGRAALDRPTLPAIRSNPVPGAFCGRAAAAGTPRVQAVGACTRKPAMTGGGVLRNRTPFDPEWASRITR